MDTALDGSILRDRDVSRVAEAADQHRSEPELEISTITVHHLGTKLHTVAIDLSGSPSDIDAQITVLAKHLAMTTERSAGEDVPSGRVLETKQAYKMRD